MASVYEQMDNLLTPDSFKEGLAKSAEENKDESMSDIFSFDRITLQRVKLMLTLSSLASFCLTNIFNSSDGVK